MATHRAKYVAEGFHEDSAKLLNEFVALNTVEFSEFATLWREHYFSLIFMGRPDHTETNEFVNEIFRITSQYLFSSSVYQQIGAVYIMYSLFRTQILDPPIMIRLELRHWKIIKSLRNDAILKKYRQLQYVIDYMIENAIDICANQTLKGPLILFMPKTSQNIEVPTSTLKAIYKSDIMRYSVTNNLSVLQNLQMQYLAEKKNIADDSKKFSLTESDNVYEERINELNEIVNPSVPQLEEENLGVRRAKIKAESYLRKPKNYLGIELDEDADSDAGAPPDPDADPDADAVSKAVVPYYGYSKKRVVAKQPRYRRPRRPKCERRVGRPSRKPKKEPPPEKKSDDDEDLNIGHLVLQQKEFFLPPKNSERKNRTKRDPYYQLSPRREDSDSDADKTGDNDDDVDNPE